MGRSYLFECPKCAYKTTVSGGADQGIDCRVQTALCRDCRRVFDAVIHLRVLREPKLSLRNTRIRKSAKAAEVPPTFEKVSNQLPLPASANFEWVQFKLGCPISRDHKVQAWNDPGKCPICSSFLEKAGLPFRRWE